ncbi:MAG: CHASE2 domain-containing protein, partial [Pseudomonadota bacterium]
MDLLSDALFGRGGFRVGFLWRLVGAGLALAFLLLTTNNLSIREAVYRVDTALIDNWQRLSSPDEPSGEVVVVGIDAESVDRKGRWPWSRLTLADLVQRIANAQPRSLTLDIALNQPSAYSPDRLKEIFGEDADFVSAMRVAKPDLTLAEALSRAPTSLAVLGADRNAFYDSREKGFALEEDLVGCFEEKLDTPEYTDDHTVACLRFPLDVFYNQTVQDAVTYNDQDLDGVIRRGRTLVTQPYTNPETGGVEISPIPAMPLAALISCGGYSDACPQLVLDPNAFYEDEDPWTGFQLEFLRPNGVPMAPASLTSSYSFWIDFGALAALDAPQIGAEASDHSVIPAIRLMEEDGLADGADGDPTTGPWGARLHDKHVLLGLTLIGGIDRHTTPLAAETGTPGVVIQALAADNMLTGRTLAQPDVTTYAMRAFAVLMALFAFLRFGFSNMAALSAVGLVLIAAPVVASWAAFEYLQTILMPATGSIAAFLAFAPVIYGRVSTIRRELADAKETAIDQAARMDVLHDMQIGSLPFDADFTADGFDTASVCTPSKEVGGDFFELQKLSDGRIFGAIGDVMGKDVHASLVSVISKAISGSVTNRTTGPLGEAFGQILQEFVRLSPDHWLNEQGGFVTLAAMRVDPETGAAEFARAGADTPIVVSKTGEVRPLDLPDKAPLGWRRDDVYDTASLTLAPGDT